MKKEAGEIWLFVSQLRETEAKGPLESGDAKKENPVKKLTTYLVRSPRAFQAAALQNDGSEVPTDNRPHRKHLNRMWSKLPNCTMGQEGAGLSFGSKEKIHSSSQFFLIEDEELLCKWTGISWSGLHWGSVPSVELIVLQFSSLHSPDVFTSSI